MGIPLLVIENCLLLDRLFCHRQGDLNRSCGIGACGFNGEFESIQQAASITASHLHQVLPGVSV